MDLIAQHQLDKASQIYYCVVKSVGDNQCTIIFNNKQYTVPYYGGKPIPNKTYAIFLPHNNMNESFVTGDGVGINEIISIEHGGTGADTAEGARVNLGLSFDSATNYCKMPDGTLIQTGRETVSHTAVGTIQTQITFGIPFASIPYVIASLDGTDLHVEKCSCASQSSTGFKLVTRNEYAGNNAITVDWIAFGRWK